MARIVQAERLLGDPDHMLHVLGVDLPSFRTFYNERLTALSGVLRLTSTLVLKSVL
jgi:DNA-binding Lrp family transcriptional regulator